MAVLSILTYPDPALKEIARPVDKISDEIKKLAEDMVQTMYEAPGSGLAAPQVGWNCRLIVMDDSTADDLGRPLIVVNPEIVSAKGDFVFEEGCLSVIDYYAKVKRAAEVVVRGKNLDGRTMEYRASGRKAVVFQHEIDHLDGILFIDRISGLKRDLYRRRLKKMMRQEKDGK
ncbi:MAG: peptide deformylase [Pseudomonadota bacterium]